MESWWPGAESNQGRGCLTLSSDYRFKRHHKLTVCVAKTVVIAVGLTQIDLILTWNIQPSPNYPHSIYLDKLFT
jgi:hypothetical protein